MQPAQVRTAASDDQSLRLPENPQVFGAAMPSVVKATAIVNGEVITQTDIDQRVALLGDRQWRPDSCRGGPTAAAAGLRNLIDETLQIEAAKPEEIEVKPAEIDRTVARVAAGPQDESRTGR